MVGLEPSIGWLHEFTGSQTKESLVYDLQEPFRWLGDVTTIEAFESGALDLKDFYFLGDDYRYHIEVEAKRRFLQLLKDRFNSGVKYKGKTWKWGTVILNKTQELGRCLLEEESSVNFIDPVPRLEKSDIQTLRKRILELTDRQVQQQLGIDKSALQYLRKRAAEKASFRVFPKLQRYHPVHEKGRR
jgi:CRISPR-associated protein Cas1